MAGRNNSYEVAAEVDRLLFLAAAKVKQAPSLAKKYVAMARTLAMRHRLPLGRGRKLLFCKECNMPWVNGFNLKVRMKSGERKIEYACACGSRMKIPYGKKADAAKP
jgi:RNase P subunit RPR2